MVMLVTVSYVASGANISNNQKIKEINFVEPLDDRNRRHYAGPVNIYTSQDFKTDLAWLRKAIPFTNTAITIFAWSIESGILYLETQSETVELGSGSSFIAGGGLFKYSGINQFENLSPIMKILSLWLLITVVDFTMIEGTGFDVTIYSPEPLP
jgi:hypothetical protein